jgi:hypothetical protein
VAAAAHERDKVERLCGYIARWRVEYNTERTHSSLGDITPAEFVAAYRQRVADTASLGDRQLEGAPLQVSVRAGRDRGEAREQQRPGRRL